MAPPYSFSKSLKVSTFKIYMSNLPDGLKNADIREWFEEFGRIVECEVFKKNYGFVHMEEEECGRKAVQALNKKEVDGKIISVSISKNVEPPNIASTKLQVKQLPQGVSAARLRTLFQKFGLVLEAELINNGTGVVSLEATGDIRTAITEMNGFELDGRTLQVEPVKVNLKAERYGSAQSQMEWQPKPPPHGYSPAYHRMESRPQPSGGRYPLGGGYGPSAQVEEFYGHEAEEYYEEEEYYAPYEYQPAPEPVRRFPMGPPAGPRLQHPGLRPGIDYVRRDATFYEDEPAYPPSRPPMAPPPQQRVARTPSQSQGYDQEYAEDAYEPTPRYPPQPHYFAGRGRGRGFGRGGGNSATSYLPPRKKLARGEPYPTPPSPNPRALLAQGFRGGFRGGMRPPRGGGMMPPGIRPKTRGRGQGPSLLAAARASAAGRATFGNTSGRQVEPDPFAPSAAEKRLLQLGGSGDPSIDFTADIMLS